MKKKNPDLATVEDVEELARMTTRALETELRPVHERLGVVEDKVTELDQKVTNLQEDVRSLKGSAAAILKVVEGIDNQLREHRDLPERVARLERTAFR